MISAFLLAASISIGGTVVNQHDQPVASARVSLTNLTGQTAGQTTTDSRGRFQFSNVAPQRYRVRVDAAAFRSQTRVVDATASSQSVRIALQPSTLTLIGSVTGRAREPFNATPLVQRIFPREAYRDEAQPSISTVLDQTPGAFTERNVNVNAGVPVAPAFAVVRGGLPFETLTQLDGAPVSLPSSGTFDTSLIPTFVLQDVEVLAGPGDVSGSGGSVDGAVNFRTAEPTAARRALPEFEGDSMGGQWSNIAYAGTLPGGKFAFASMASIDGSPGATEGFTFPVAGACCATFAGDELRRALLLDVRAMPSSELSITATMLGVNLDRDLAATLGAQFPGASAFTLSPSLNAIESDRLRFERVQGQYGSGDDTFSAQAYDLGLAQDLDSSAIAAAAYDTEAGGNFTWSHAVAQNRYDLQIAGSTGTAESNDPYANPLLPGSRTGSFRIRADALLQPAPRDRWELAVEENALNARFAPSGSAFTSRSWTPVNGRVGYAHTLLPGLALRGSVGTSAVPAPLAALSGYPSLFVPAVGAPAHSVSIVSGVTTLERANGVDAGLEWQLHGQTTTVTADVYRSQTQGAYIPETSAVTSTTVLERWFNGPAMVDDGVEVAISQFKRVGLGYVARLSLPRTYVQGPLPASFYAAGNLAVLPNQNISGGAFGVPGENDVAPVRVPYAQGYAELSYKWPRGSRASIGALYLGANNAYARTAFATLNANIELSAGARGKLQFSVENLTDALDAPLPLAYVGAGVPLANGLTGATNANVMAPRTLRFMYRQSFGEGSIYEH